MLLIATGVALLVIFAGMKLLAQTKKDALGNMFKYVSWFITIMGFLMLLCVGAHCIMRHCHRGGHCMMMKTEMRSGGCGSGEMGGMNSCHRGMMMGGSCCGGMMNGYSNGNSCCATTMGGGCNGGMMNKECNEEMGSSCNSNMKGGMKECTMKKDSVVVIKKK